MVERAFFTFIETQGSSYFPISLPSLVTKFQTVVPRCHFNSFSSTSSFHPFQPACHPLGLTEAPGHLEQPPPSLHPNGQPSLLLCLASEQSGSRDTLLLIPTHVPELLGPRPRPSHPVPC